MRLYKGYDIGYDEGSRACESFVGLGFHRASPSSLVEGECFDATGGQGRKEVIVAVDVVVEAVDEDYFRNRRSIGLDGWS